MINKTYKIIHNKYSSIFKFLFFLRYLFVIFIISFGLFLCIPKFFDYDKKEQIIKNHFFKNYNLKLNSLESVKYKLLPMPNLEIKNANFDFDNGLIKLNSTKVNVYLKLNNIYNYKAFDSKKIILNKSNISLDINEFKILSKYILKLKNKLSFKDLNLIIIKENKTLTEIKKINYSNYGYKKNSIEGILFNKKFKIKQKNYFQVINFKLLNTGIDVKINLLDKKKNLLVGNLKAKVLNSNLKFNFELNDKKLIINDSYFRNKNISFDSKNIITFQPFFNIASNIMLKDINLKKFEDIDLENLLNFKSFIKKLNSKNIISYKKKKFSRALFDDFNFNINLEYGRLIYSKSFLNAEGTINCNGDVNLVDEYPILNFKCNIFSKDKKKFLKKLSLKYKKNNELLNLDIEGYLNIFNKKITFIVIKMNNEYIATKEDLKYFKESFETILFDKDFISIFKINKIKKFLIEIS